MREWKPDQHTQITYDPEVRAFYIIIHDKLRHSGTLQTETLQDVNDGPLINVDRVGDTVVGVEIIA